MRIHKLTCHHFDYCNNLFSADLDDLLHVTVQFVILKNIDIPLCLWDERLSTAGAFNLSSQLDVNVSKKVKYIDQNAAAFILQGAIDYLKN